MLRRGLSAHKYNQWNSTILFLFFFFLSRNYYEHGIHRNYMYLKYRKNCHKILKKSYANFLNELSLAQKTWCVLFEMTSILGSQLQLHFRVSFPFMILKYNSTGSRLYVVTLFLILNKCYSWVFFLNLSFVYLSLYCLLHLQNMTNICRVIQYLCILLLC